MLGWKSLKAGKFRLNATRRDFGRCGDVNFGSVEVASAVADLVRDSPGYKLVVQALSEVE